MANSVAGPPRSGLPRPLIGIVRNEGHQAPPYLRADPAGFALSFVEFDDQGRCYRRGQMEAVEDWIAGSADAIVLVFMHGWKHDARDSDENLASFRKVLAGTVGKEREESSRAGRQARPVLGLFAAWRGMTLFDRRGWLDNLPFWDRQQAGHRVAQGAVRELLGRLRLWRKTRLEGGGAPLLVVVGHSFGGMIVFSALSQSLIEAATARSSTVVPGFADLVLLVNPAIEGERYLPIHDLVVQRSQRGACVDQPPVFICATATNDWATGWAFPIGNLGSFLSESCLDRLERQSVIHTIGHIDWMRTHVLKGDSSTAEYRLERTAGEGPFWIVSAAPAVIDGHNGIFGERFLAFAADQVFRHVLETARKVVRPAAALADVEARPRPQDASVAGESRS